MLGYSTGRRATKSTGIFEAARLIAADHLEAAALFAPLDEERGLALRTGPRNRTLPEGEVTLGIAVAGKEGLPPPGPLLDEGSAASFLRTGHTGADRLGIFTFGITGAGHKAAEAAVLNHHRLAALLADFVGGGLFLDDLDAVGSLDELFGVLAVGVAGTGDEAAEAAPFDHHRLAALLASEVGRGLLPLHIAHLDLSPVELFAERLVETADRIDPLLLPLFDSVQLALHLGGEFDIHHIRKVLDQKLVDHLPQFGRIEAAFPFLDVLPILNRRDDGGVGARPADPLLLQIVDEESLVIPGRGLGEVLLRVERLQGKTVPHRELR